MCNKENVLGLVVLIFASFIYASTGGGAKGGIIGPKIIYPEIIVGSGTNDWEYPLSTYYEDARTQTIYHADEIGGSCTIAQLRLDIVRIPGQTMNYFTIRMKHTDLDDYSTTAQWQDSGWTVVYQGNVTIAATGWFDFPFSTPFVYDGTRNLMVDISFDNYSWTSDGLCRCSRLGGSRSLFHRTDSQYGNPLEWVGISPTPYTSDNAPNLKLSLTGVVVTTVPDLSGLTQSQAEAALLAAGLVTRDITEAYSSTVPAGYVVEQSYAAGTLLPEGFGVSISISQGLFGDDYIAAGKTYLFKGTISDIHLAYSVFELAMNDPDEPKTRELLFLHSVSRTMMLFVRNDGGAVDSFREIAARFDVEITGDTLDFEYVELTYPENENGDYEIPEGAPDGDEIHDLFNNWLAVEIGLILDNLELISETPSDLFAVFFEPEHTGMSQRFMVGYGEVLLLKGILMATQANITAGNAYNTTLNNFDDIMAELDADTFSINNHLLIANPEMFKLLPTPNDPSIGKDALSQAKADMLYGIDYTIDGIEYVKSQSNSWQGIEVERFLYIEEDDFGVADSVIGIFEKLRDSILNDNSQYYTLETSKAYDLSSSKFDSGRIVILYDFLGIPVCGGSLDLTGGSITSSWEIDEAHTDNEDPLYVELWLESYADGNWSGGYIGIYFNSDKTEVESAYFEYWGHIGSGTIEDINGQLLSTETSELELDLNPIYGSTRYPEPVSPRLLLPEFDEFNTPLAGTFGNGIGYDATLGGILPGMTQEDWELLFGLEPQIMIPLVTGWNWISFNALPEDTGIASVFSAYSAVNNDVIVAGTGKNATYWDGIWYGTLQEIEAGVMYRLKSGGGASFGVTGNRVDPCIQIPLVSGWNWIGCSHSVPIALSEAFASLEKTNNDVIVSPDGKNATYWEGVWYGTLETLKPGAGYMLKVGKSQIFSYCPD